MTAVEPPADDTQAIIAEMWERFRPLAMERVATIAAYTGRSGMQGPDDGDRDAATTAAARKRARDAAHSLSGSLGSFGLPMGSVLAARLETLLAAEQTDEDAVGQILLALEHEVRR